MAGTLTDRSLLLIKVLGWARRARTVSACPHSDACMSAVFPYCREMSVHSALKDKANLQFHGTYAVAVVLQVYVGARVCEQRLDSRGVALA